MAKLSLTPEINLPEIIIEGMSENEKVISLNGAESAYVSSLLRYAKSHGPALYGVKYQRSPKPAYDAFLFNLHDKIATDHPLYTAFDNVVGNEGDDKTITLSGSEVRALRAMVAFARNKGKSLFSVTSEQEPDYNSFVASLFSKL